MENDFWQDDVWDEERWEAFLREHDRRIDRYMDLVFQFMRVYPCPSHEETLALERWKEALRAFLYEKGWHTEDLAFSFLWGEEALGEELEHKGLLGEALETLEEDFEDVQRLPVYQDAMYLTTSVLSWADTLSLEVKDLPLVHFCSHVTQVPSNIARGHGIGRERDFLGGNIACAKRALGAANAALDLLREIKTAVYMDPATYHTFFELAFELRNALGLYVQELRDLFNLGID